MLANLDHSDFIDTLHSRDAKADFPLPDTYSIYWLWKELVVKYGSTLDSSILRPIHGANIWVKLVWCTVTNNYNTCCCWWLSVVWFFEFDPFKNAPKFKVCDVTASLPMLMVHWDDLGDDLSDWLDSFVWNRPTITIELQKRHRFSWHALCHIEFVHQNCEEIENYSSDRKNSR